MIARISIKLALHTDFGACGPRLERGAPLPSYEFVFEDTVEGREKAERARQQLQDYVNKYHVPKFAKKL